jgi:hypothetical protein
MRVPRLRNTRRSGKQTTMRYDITEKTETCADLW